MKNLILRSLAFYLDTLSLVAPATAAKKGFQLFCRPFRVPVTEKQKSFFDAAEKFHLTHDTYKIQGYRWGNGPRKVLFLHGWQSHSYRWKTYIEALPKDDYTIYALDAPGHGLSSGNFLSVPLYSSVIEKFMQQHNGMHSIIAHSLGGFSLLYSLYRQSLPVDRVVLLAPPGEASEFIASFQKGLGISDRTVRLVIDHFAHTYRVTPDYFSMKRFVEKVQVKGLIIHDEDDTEAPYRHSIPLHQAWNQSRLITTKGYGHNLKSTSVVKHVVDFVTESMKQPAIS